MSDVMFPDEWSAYCLLVEVSYLHGRRGSKHTYSFLMRYETQDRLLDTMCDTFGNDIILLSIKPMPITEYVYEFLEEKYREMGRLVE